MRIFLLALMPLSLTQCSVNTVGYGTLPYESIRANFEYFDNRNLQRIELTYTNNANYTVFIPEGNWPYDDRIGLLREGLIILYVGERRFPAEGAGSHCRSSCTLAVRPAQTVRGFISYRSFNLPTELHGLNKRLEFLEGPWVYRNR